jgi:hypothetical protein
MPPYVKYDFELRTVVRVRDHSQRPWQVTWRGSLLCDERIRRPVYRLDNDNWDVYFEDELHSAWGNF